jgi:hypothetical protein
LKKIKKEFKALGIKEEDKLDAKILGSHTFQLNNSVEKAVMDKKNKYALSQADSADDDKNMDNINMIKSAADVKKQSNI